ncbi:MAG TPA: hypothetical protein VNL13_04525 [Sulfolobales archaeon]|nr:hypothetical protein [Sulfolobales archaeon]
MPHESGKTTIAKALVGELVSRGYRVGVAKPVAGHNIWYQRLSVRNSYEHRILVGEDAVELKRVSGSEDPLEAINPLDIAVAPQDPEPYLKNLRSYHEALSSILLSAAMIRVSICEGKNIHTHHYIVEKRVERTPKSIKDLVLSIAEKVYPKPIPIDPEALENLILTGYATAELCYRYLSEKHQALVLESFNDAASPVTDPGAVDLVLAVSPGKLFIYNGSVYRKALNIVLGIEGSIHRKWWPSTSEVLRLISPISSINIPFLEDIGGFASFAETLTDRVEGLVRSSFSSNNP